MKLLRLSPYCAVMPDEVSEVTYSQESGVTTVRLKSGVGHKIVAEYRESPSDLYRKILNAIDEALQ